MSMQYSTVPSLIRCHEHWKFNFNGVHALLDVSMTLSVVSIFYTGLWHEKADNII